MCCSSMHPDHLHECHNLITNFPQIKIFFWSDEPDVNLTVEELDEPMALGAVEIGKNCKNLDEKFLMKSLKLDWPELNFS